MPLRESDSDESIDQLEQFRNANVKPGMFVSGWEDPNDEVFEEKNPRETLHKEILWATGEGKADLVESILMRDITTKDSRDEDGYTPLHRAAYSNNVEIAKILIQYGADVNARTEFGWTPLHSAVKWSNAEAASFLLQHGADVNALSQGQQTPLHIAATVSNCRETAMTLLMEPNCNASALNNSAETAAEIARRTGRLYPLFEMGHSAFTVETGLVD
ncbi:ankyrin repeat domain-containing protein 49 [Sitodiplosis mosellana]|uniref:ankyrin repeat domain-containing protein 49 n=1 Tax=Sitodiplosis mosellana TaxID=263140 RepID=UPI0024447870|nr:ankyrin repeat domain-containing protein 49 [Sitodiplosis mosellana]